MPGTATTEKLKAPKEKVGVLLIIEGFPDHFNFDVFVGFFNHIFPVLPKGFFAGGPIEGETPYTLIHYANHEEAEVCGVAEGTPIDAFGNEYKGTYPIHSMEDHLTNDDHGYPDALAAIVLTYGHSTIDPATSKEIKGPHVDDPAGSGIGIADFIEMYGFKLMKQCFYLPGNRIPTTPHYAQWWYGKDIPAHYGSAPSHPTLANIKDALASAMPDREWVLRIGSVSYMDNRDAYGNTNMVADSTKTALYELTDEQGVDRIVVLSCDAIGTNLLMYGSEWYDKNGRGISAIPGKTFKECVEDLSNGLGPTKQEDLDEFLAEKPWHMHKGIFSGIKEIIGKTAPHVTVTFARPLGECEGYERAVLDILNHTIAKYSIPRTASLRVILAGHGTAGGYKDAQECDCYSRRIADFFSRAIAQIEGSFSWSGTCEVVSGENEFSEAENDPVSEDKPFGDVWSVGELIDTGINGQYVNELGKAVDNGTGNFDYIIVIPVFAIAESLDTLIQLRESLGNNVYDRMRGFYKRDGDDGHGLPHYKADNFDEEYCTVKVFDATDCPSVPGYLEDPECEAKGPKIYKGSVTHPTTVIITGAFLSFGNGPARAHFTEAGVEAIIEACED